MATKGLPYERSVYQMLQTHYNGMVQDIYMSIDESSMYRYQPVLVDGRMHMYGERDPKMHAKERTHGITLNVYALLDYWAAPKYECVRSETVPFGTSRKEQERVLRSMCDIYATQKQADYRLVCPWA